MNKIYNQTETILVDRHTVSGNYSVIFQVLAFQKVINKRRYIFYLVRDPEINFSCAVIVFQHDNAPAHTARFD